MALARRSARPGRGGAGAAALVAVAAMRSLLVALGLVAGLSLPYLGLGLPLPDWAADSTQPRMALAVIDGTSNTVRNIGSPLALGAGGSIVAVTGHVTCTPLGEVVTIQVVITQPTTGATAAGQAQAACTGARSNWSTLAVALGPASFLPGGAQACALATGPTTFTQWCRAGGVILVPSGLVGGPPLLPPPPPMVLPPPPPPVLLPPPLPPWGDWPTAASE